MLDGGRHALVVDSTSRKAVVTAPNDVHAASASGVAGYGPYLFRRAAPRIVIPDELWALEFLLVS